MDLSIVVVNWNTEALLTRCLQSIYTTVNGMKFEVFVVDNASTDNSVMMVREYFPNVDLIENTENLGFAHANNQAIQRAQGRYVLLLNSDAELVSGATHNMVQFLDVNPAAGIASVCLAFPDGSPQFCYGSFPDLYREFRSLFGLHRWDMSCWGKLDTPREVDWVSGACLMVRKVMLDQIGLLDEDYFMFGEEVDLCYRATQAGWKVYLVPSSPVIHVRAGSTGKTSGRIYRLYHGKLRYTRLHLGRAQSGILLVVILLSTLGKLVLYTILSLVWPSAKERSRLWWDVTKLILSRFGWLTHAYQGVNRQW